MAAQGKLKLVSSDKVELEVEYNVALEMGTVKNFMQVAARDTIIHVPNVSSAILTRVIEYIKYHLEAKQAEKSEEEVKIWDRQFVDVDQQTLYDVLMASHYLTINDLFEFLCQTVAGKISDLSPEQMVALFNIRNEHTKEEEERIKRENAWAYD